MSIGRAVDRINERVSETTTSDAIAYLPSGFTNVRKALKTLARMKKHWKIDVVDETDKYKVCFGEGLLEVDVNKEHWADFMAKVLGKKKVVHAGNFEVDLGGYLKEAKDDDIRQASAEFEKSLYRVLMKDPIKQAGENIAIWNKTVQKLKNSTGANVMIKFEDMKNDVKGVTSSVQTIYEEDRGMLELLTSALQQLRPLGTFEPFDKYEYFVGTRIESTWQKIPLAYETFVDMSFVPHEHIVCEEREVLDELQGVKGIRVATNTIFPTGKQFTAKQIKAVRDAIDDTAT